MTTMYLIGVETIGSVGVRVAVPESRIRALSSAGGEFIATLDSGQQSKLADARIVNSAEAMRFLNGEAKAGEMIPGYLPETREKKP